MNSFAHVEYFFYIKIIFNSINTALDIGSARPYFPYQANDIFCQVCLLGKYFAQINGEGAGEGQSLTEPLSLYLY